MTNSDLRQIPGVGKKTQEDLIALGYPTVASLKNVNPEALYQADCKKRGFIIDRCQLYVYRCAVYYATQAEHDPEKLKWWNWTDERMKQF